MEKPTNLVFKKTGGSLKQAKSCENFLKNILDKY